MIIHSILMLHETSTVHSRYIRNDVKQTLTNAYLDFANPIEVIIDGVTRRVPFTLNGSISWSGAVRYLNAVRDLMIFRKALTLDQIAAIYKETYIY